MAGDSFENDSYEKTVGVDITCIVKCIYICTYEIKGHDENNSIDEFIFPFVN